MVAMIKGWLLNQFGPKILLPCRKAKATYVYIMKLENVKSRAFLLLNALEHGWQDEEKYRIEQLKTAINEIENYRNKEVEL